MPLLQPFYGTFMQKQATKNTYVEILAPDMNAARAAMFDHFGEKFCTVYDAVGFEGQAEKYHLTRLGPRILVTQDDFDKTTQYYDAA